MSGGAVVWVTGLPASGKSTFAARLAERLRAAGRSTVTLDGDAVRGALCPAPGYAPRERDAFYATLGGLAALVAAQGHAVLVPATAHRRAYREAARAAAPRFLEVWVRTPLAECERRDPKGIYALTRTGGAAGVPGVDVPFEEPEAPDVTAEGGRDDAALERALALLEQAS